MRRLHRTHFVILTVGLTFCVVVTHYVHRYQARKTVDHIQQMASKEEAAGQPERALHYYDLYLLKRPRDINARVRSAEIALTDRFLSYEDGPRRAIEVIENLLQIDPTQTELRLRMVRIMIDSPGELGGVAQAHLASLEKDVPNDGRVPLYQGWLAERTGRDALAAGYYERSLKLNPNLIDTYNRLARLYRTRLRERVKADRLMDIPQPANGLIQNNPSNPLAYLGRVFYCREFNVTSPADDIAKALELAPNNLDVLINAARESTLKDKLDVARIHLKRAEELFPEDFRVYLASAAVESRAGQFDESLKVLRRGRDKILRNLELQWNYADLLVQLGRADEAEPEIQRLRELGTTREITDFLLNLNLLARQKWSEAAPLLEQSAKQLSSKAVSRALARRAYLSLGRCYAELGNTDLQLTSYNRALQIDSSIDDRQTIQARSGVAAALVDMGRLPEAIEEYRKNLSIPNAPPDTKIILARLLIFQNLRLLESYRRWDEVEQLLETAGKNLPNSSEVVILQAESLAAQQKLNPARQLLEKARDEHPDRPDLWVALSILALRQEQPQEAFRLLDEAEKKLGDKLEFRIARARLWGRQGGPKAPENLAMLEKNLSAWNNTQRRELIAGIAEAYAQIGDPRTALAFWKRLGEEQPRDLTPRLIQFDMALQDGQRAEVERVIKEIEAIEGKDGSISHYAQSRLLMDEFRRTSKKELLTQARDQVELVRQRRPAWSRPPLTQGEIDDLMGNHNSALRGYLQAIRLGDRSPLAIRRAIEILYDQRHYTEADQVLRQLQEQLPISSELQRMAADISIQQNDYTRALNLARKAVSTESPNYNEHIWLGRVLWIISQRAKNEGKKEQAETHKKDAERQLRRAVELGPDKPDSWVALIQFLVLIDQKPAAERALAEAEKAIPPAEAPFALAQASQALGQTERTEALYLKAIQLKPDDALVIQGIANFYLSSKRMQDAEPHLRKLIELKQTSPEQGRWATRILSQILSQGSFSQSVKALEILGLTDASAVDANKSSAEPVDDLRAKAYVLARQQTRTRLREAKRLLEEILRREAPVPFDVFLYGNLCEMEGNWAKARDQFQTAVTMAPNEPYFIAEFTRALLRHNLNGEAATWVTRLEKLNPASPEAVELRARLMARQGRGKEAATLITDYIKDKESRLRISADLLEQLGQFDSAEELFRRYAKQAEHPENQLYLAAFIGRRQRTSEALDLCDQCWTTCKPEDVAAAAVQIIYGAESSNQYYERIAVQLQKMVAQHPDKVALLFELANIRGLQGRVDEAKRIYLETFEKNPGNVAPLNNLAWMLAFQEGGGKPALEYINQAIGGYSPVPALLDTRAVVQMALNDPEAAIRDLEDAIAVESNPGRQLHLAEAYLMGKRKTDAQSALKEARRTGLDEKNLHPFERKPYRALIEQIDKGEKNP